MGEMKYYGKATRNPALKLPGGWGAENPSGFTRTGSLGNC
ncbi:protein of unknown function [Hyphomicrobium sp. 1Nfss2.1]